MPVKLNRGADLNNNRALNVADPTAPTDGANKQYVDGVARGLDWKAEVVAGSLANVSLTAPGATMDGVTLAVNDRVILMGQTAPAEGGIYVWTGAAVTMTRALDADSGPELSGSTVTIQRGTTLADRVYRVNTDDPLTLGTTAIVFAQVGAGGSAYLGGNGLLLTGSTFDVGAGNGISVAADSIAVDPTVVVRKYAADCVATTNPQTFAHGLGTGDIEPVIWEGSTQVYPDVTKTGTTTITVDWGGAPTAAQYRVVAHG